MNHSKNKETAFIKQMPFKQALKEKFYLGSQLQHINFDICNKSTKNHHVFIGRYQEMFSLPPATIKT